MTRENRLFSVTNFREGQPLPDSRPRHQVHRIIPDGHRVGPGKTDQITRPQPEPERLCGTVGTIRQRGMSV